MPSKKACLIFGLIAVTTGLAFAQQAPTIPIPKLSLGVSTAKNPHEVASSLQILLILTVLSIAPSIVVMMTSFTRIVIVFSFMRSAIGTQQLPPNSVLAALALFLTYCIMAPTINTVNHAALQPYLHGQISQMKALDAASIPLRKFMLKQTREKDLGLVMRMSGMARPKTVDDTPFILVVPAFMMSELKTAFQIGFALFIPFIIVDMVIASTLMSLGMMMLPPVMISLPFKILLFVLVDGWYLVVQSLWQSYQ